MAFNYRDITAEESEELLHALWVLLRYVESTTDPETDPLRKKDVDRGYKVLNDLGLSDSCPRWELTK